MPDWQYIVVGILIALALAVTVRNGLKGVRSGCAEGGCGCASKKAESGGGSSLNADRLGVRKEIISLGTPKPTPQADSQRGEPHH